MRVAPYKSLTGKCARKACAQETNNQSVCTWNERTYIKLKLILSLPGLSVPSSKINCISRRFRLVLLPLHCLTQQMPHLTCQRKFYMAFFFSIVEIPQNCALEQTLYKLPGYLLLLRIWFSTSLVWDSRWKSESLV